MNILAFVGKIGFINFSIEKNEKIAQVIFVESVDDQENYIPCTIPHKVLFDFEDHIQEGTILQVKAHLLSNIIVKDGKTLLEQKIVVDSLSYFSLNEEETDVVQKIGKSYFKNISNLDVPF